ncbi:hypothetical protein BpHYR1_037693, partial [Brachionus plicatilis]
MNTTAESRHHNAAKYVKKSPITATDGKLSSTTKAEVDKNMTGEKKRTSLYNITTVDHPSSPQMNLTEEKLFSNDTTKSVINLSPTKTSERTFSGARNVNAGCTIVQNDISESKINWEDDFNLAVTGFNTSLTFHDLSSLNNTNW